MTAPAPRRRALPGRQAQAFPAAALLQAGRGRQPAGAHRAPFWRNWHERAGRVPAGPGRHVGGAARREEASCDSAARQAGSRGSADRKAGESVRLREERGAPRRHTRGRRVRARGCRALGLLGRVRAVPADQLRHHALIRHGGAHAGRGRAVLLVLAVRSRAQLAAMLHDRSSAARLVVFGAMGLFLCQITYAVVIGYTNAGTATVLQSTGHRVRHAVLLRVRARSCRCVPTSTCTSPSAKPRRAQACCAGERKRESTSTRTPKARSVP